MKKRILIIGGKGNVGSGIALAVKNSKKYLCNIIDPQINNFYHKLSTQKRRKLLRQTNYIIYAADCGNRDLYNENVKNTNNKHFKQLCEDVKKYNQSLSIYYIGGSWTKRKPNKKWIVDDSSPNKPLAECNDYERAKISAEKNALKLSKTLKIKVRFFDYISIVPNLSQNFSIYKMTESAYKNNLIIYSPGPYGRPLLDTLSAGKLLLDILTKDEKYDNFTIFLIPGVFIPFTIFAKTVKKVIERKTKTKVKLIKQKETPEFLKTQIKSKLINATNKKLLKKKIINSLEINTEKALELLQNSQTSN